MSVIQLDAPLTTYDTQVDDIPGGHQRITPQSRPQDRRHRGHADRRDPPQGRRRRRARAELTEAHYVTARRLFLQAAPFAGENPTPPALATDEQRDDLRRRLAALPDDIRKTIEEAA